MTPASYPTPLYPADWHAVEPTPELRASAERAAVQAVVERMKAEKRPLQLGQAARVEAHR